MGATGVGLNWTMTIIAIALFFIITCGIGLFVARVNLVRKLEDYLVAGRSQPWPLMVAALVGGWIYTSSTMGAAESSLSFGAAGIWMYSMFGLSLLAVMFVIGRFRKIADHLGISSITEFVKERFDPKAHWMCLIIIWSGSVLTLMLNIIGAGFVVRGLSLGAVPFWVAVVAIGAITLVYVLWGGYWASSLSSWVLMLISTFAVLSSVPFIVSGAGGLASVVRNVQTHDPSMLNLFNPAGMTAFLPAAVLYGLAAWGVQEWYQPGISCDGRGLRTGYFLSFLWVFAITALSGSIGFIGFSLISTGAVAPPNAPSEVYPHLVALFAPNWVSFLILFLVFGAGSTTVALTAMAQATMLKGAYKYWCSLKGTKPMDEATLQQRLRIYITAVIGFSVVFGIIFEPSVLTMVLLADGVFSPVGIPILLGMVWRKVNPNGIFWGALLGIIVVLATFWTISPGTAAILGTAIGTLVTVIWTLLGPKDFAMERLGLGTEKAPGIGVQVRG